MVFRDNAAGPADHLRDRTARVLECSSASAALVAALYGSYNLYIDQEDDYVSSKADASEGVSATVEAGQNYLPNEWTGELAVSGLALAATLLFTVMHLYRYRQRRLYKKIEAARSRVKNFVPGQYGALEASANAMQTAALGLGKSQPPVSTSNGTKRYPVQPEGGGRRARKQILERVIGAGGGT